ncbi:MAG: metal-dependent hydrolase, partial [Candidatus Thermoplasmatota archaeon]|nr:metal-dependent hydrolase [Candidatus Thermoplasmatota archaeon]
MEAVNMFIKAGGNSFNLVNLPEDFGALSNRYKAIYEQTLKLAGIIRSETSLDVVVTLGPYPLDYFLFTDHGMNPLEYMKAGIDLAAKYILDGKANAIGEIGRPHFPVADSIIEAS